MTKGALFLGKGRVKEGFVLSDTEGILLVLCSGRTPGGVLETLCMSRMELGDGTRLATAGTCYLFYLSNLWHVCD